MPYSQEDIHHALSHVKYPGSGKNLEQMGMIGNITSEAGTVRIELIFQKKKDPFAVSLKKAVEGAVKYYVNPEAEVVVTEIFIPIQNESVKKEPDGLKNVENIIAIASGKGGVGKSTISANLAVSLAKMGFRTGLLDADIYGPSIPKMFHVEGEMPAVNTHDGKDIVIPVERYGVKLLSVGFFVKENDAAIWRGPMASSALKQFLFQTDWGTLDYLLIDLPPGTSDIHLTLVQETSVTGAIIVSTPQDVAVADAVKGLSMFTNGKINVPVLGLVENMSWFSPAELPENKYYIFGRGGCRKLAEKMNIPLLGEIPLVQSICEDGDSGNPTALDETTPVGRAFAEFAGKVVEQVNYRNANIAETKKVEITYK
ncbi:MAG: Mrp/NBP35 family ATP-binding protein [Bacteroidia bacterium]|nr:Mrp/NBP35 family ATP-binding protein [Bacteroidia bacterium]